LRTIVYSIVKVLPRLFIQSFRFILRSFSEAGRIASTPCLLRSTSGASKASAGAMVRGVYRKGYISSSNCTRPVHLAHDAPPLPAIY